MNKMVSLCDVMKRANTKVDKDNTYLQYYIGGDHFDTGEVRVKRYGEIAGSIIGPMFYYGFRAGQFLLVSRNPHLKKAGLVSIDGICSEKTFVLETADPNILLQEYLPFVLQNERFWDYAMTHGHGSTNKFLNWSDLAQYQFELPEINEQKKIASLLWAIERTKDAYKAQIEKSDELAKSQFVEMFGDVAENPMQWPEATLKDVCIGKLSYGSGAAAVDYDGSIRYVRITDITENGELSNDVKSPNIIEEKYLLHDGDILFARSGATVGKTLRFREQFGRCIYAGFLIRLIPDRAKVVPDYVFGFTKSSFYEEFVRKTQRAVGQPNINAQEYGDLKICVPPLELQREFSSFLAETDKSKLAAKQALESLNAMQKALMRKHLGGE